jgi:formamidopyrimidine-DNA glycosylase
MPELPEVEHLRRSLEPWIVGAQLIDVRVLRKSVVTLASETGRSNAVLRAALGVGETIVGTDRRGKQMAIAFANGRFLVIQLGMTGSVTIERGAPPRGVEARHRHVIWNSYSPARPSEPEPWRLVFRDPRRFGGLTAYHSREVLDRVWNTLGPDALNIAGDELLDALARTRRPIKSALLDQSVLAGVGNIYADESLHAAGIHPLQTASAVPTAQVHRLASEIRRILGRATAEGGSTLRDYRDAFGKPGNAVQVHAAYGREGQPCLRCGTILLGLRLQGRATVFCPRCQDLST